MKKTIMTFGKDEMETVILYDYLTDTYTIETNVQKHITTCLKKYPKQTTINTVNKNGNPTSIIVKGLKNVITFRSLS